MKIPEVRYVNFCSKRNFGIELEISKFAGIAPTGNNKSPPKDLVKVVSLADPDRLVHHSDHYEQDFDNNYWHVKFDRSCGFVKNQGGWEVASYKACGYKDVNKMGNVADALYKAGAVVNNECGYHIHVEIADFKHDQAASLVAYWMMIEPVICEMLPKHRCNNNIYCKLLSKRFASLGNKVMTAANFWDSVRPHRFNNPNRRVSLNMCNYAQWLPNRKTVELRLPECVLNSKDVKNWLRLFIIFVDSVKNKQFPGKVTPVNLYETMKIIGLHCEEPFFILSKSLRETKMWFMKRILTYSAKKSVREEANRFLNALRLSRVRRMKEDAPQKVTPYEEAHAFRGGEAVWQDFITQKEMGGSDRLTLEQAQAWWRTDRLTEELGRFGNNRTI